MKKVVIATQHDLSKQLDLGKEIVANLTEEQLQQIEGGAAAGAQISCYFLTCNGPVSSEAAES
jgi:bacteriocin-like protein